MNTVVIRDSATAPGFSRSPTFAASARSVIAARGRPSPAVFDRIVLVSRFISCKQKIELLADLSPLESAASPLGRAWIFSRINLLADIAAVGQHGGFLGQPLRLHRQPRAAGPSAVPAAASERPAWRRARICSIRATSVCEWSRLRPQHHGANSAPSRSRNSFSVAERLFDELRAALSNARGKFEPGVHPKHPGIGRPRSDPAHRQTVSAVAASWKACRYASSQRPVQVEPLPTDLRASCNQDDLHVPARHVLLDQRRACGFKRIEFRRPV